MLRSYAPSIVLRKELSSSVVSDYFTPDFLRVTLHDGVAVFTGFVRKDRGVWSAENNSCTSFSNLFGERVTKASIKGVNADSDQIAWLDFLKRERFHSLIHQVDIPNEVLLGDQGRQHRKSPWSNKGEFDSFGPRGWIDQKNAKRTSRQAQLETLLH